MLIVSYVLDI